MTYKRISASVSSLPRRYFPRDLERISSRRSRDLNSGIDVILIGLLCSCKTALVHSVDEFGYLVEIIPIVDGIINPSIHLINLLGEF